MQDTYATLMCMNRSSTSSGDWINRACCRCESGERGYTPRIAGIAATWERGCLEHSYARRRKANRESSISCSRLNQYRSITPWTRSYQKAVRVACEAFRGCRREHWRFGGMGVLGLGATAPSRAASFPEQVLVEAMRLHGADDQGALRVCAT